MPYNPLQNFRISLTSDLTKGHFVNLGIAAPTTTQYKGFAEAVGQSEGGQAQHGYKNVVLTWVSVDARTVYLIRKFVDDCLAGNKTLHMTIPMNDGAKPGRRFIDISGRPHPIDVNEQGVPEWGMSFDTLTLTVNNVTVVNNPSTIE